jgi:predicted nuclease with RNAse H fold
MTKIIKYFAGIDVQIKRGCSYYIIDRKSKYVDSGWVKSDKIVDFKKIFSELTDKKTKSIAIGIDAPRMPLVRLRNRYFNRNNSSWTIKSVESIGRECEVIINSHRIANCQWTNTKEKSPDWMKLGFSIFDSLKQYPFVYEVFPSASYKMLKDDMLTYELCLKEFPRGVKDMLDASVAAVTVKEFIDGKGEEVGGEDGLGTIVLPRKLKDL